jgi:serine/threonine-protein kinase
MTFDEAKEALKELNLGIERNTTQEASDVYEEGTIMAQSVKKGKKVDKNTTIVVTISSGEAQLEMIDVVGLDRATAAKQLEEELDANVKEEYEYSEDVAEGKVISTSPKEGTSISKGADVTLVLSRGAKPAEKVTVPNVSTGSYTEETAKKELTQAGLTVGSTSTEYSSTVAKGYVIGQSYSGGKSVDAGTAIDLVISDGPKPTTTAATTTTTTTTTAAKAYKGSFTIQASQLPSDFESGKVTITLTQTVNGSEKTTTIYGGNLSKSDFPYSKTVDGAANVNSGTIQMVIDGNVVYTETISFKAE